MNNIQFASRCDKCGSWLFGGEGCHDCEYYAEIYRQKIYATRLKISIAISLICAGLVALAWVK